jgi:hypothetical protein
MGLLKRGMTFGFVASLAMLGWAAVGQAATCTVDTTDPDSFITGAKTTSSCGLGLAGSNNDSEGEIVTLLGGTWTLIDKSDDDGSGSNNGALQNTGDNSNAGNWFVDLDSLNFEDLVLVIKDGQDAGNGAKWAYFYLDLEGGCSIANKPAGADICGEWQMYAGKDLSHLSLYGTGTGTTTQVPGPAPLVLVGLGLVGMGVARRRR